MIVVLFLNGHTENKPHAFQIDTPTHQRWSSIGLVELTILNGISCLLPSIWIGVDHEMDCQRTDIGCWFAGLSMEARASSTLLSYPWPVDPCETFDENQGCVPVDDPNQLYWTIFDREFDHEWY